MGLLKHSSPWEKEYRRVWRQEEKFLSKYEEKEPSALQVKLEELAPERVVETLHAAFVKAFGLVFEKGAGAILRAGKIEEKRETYQLHQYAADLRETRKNLRAFSRAAGRAGRGNVLLSGAAGVSMGAFGVMLPDVPLFTALLLKSIYEIGESYGYRTEQEQIYALRLIEAALSGGEALRKKNAALDVYAQSDEWQDAPTLKAQVEATARKLSEAVLYTKVLQNIPLVGTVGGAGDAAVLSRVQRYAAIKYEKRFLIGRKLKQMKP